MVEINNKINMMQMQLTIKKEICHFKVQEFKFNHKISNILNKVI